jgi:hypothetical protein
LKRGMTLPLLSRTLPKRTTTNSVPAGGREGDALGEALAGAHDAAGADGLVGGDEDEAADASGLGGGEGGGGAEDIGLEGAGGVLLHERHMLVGGAWKRTSTALSARARRSWGGSRTSPMTQARAGRVGLAEAPVEVVEVELGELEEGQAGRAIGGELAAQFATDAAAGAGDHDALAADEGGDVGAVELDGLSPEEVLDLDVADVGDVDLAIGDGGVVGDHAQGALGVLALELGHDLADAGGGGVGRQEEDLGDDQLAGPAAGLGDAAEDAHAAQGLSGADALGEDAEEVAAAVGADAVDELVGGLRGAEDEGAHGLVGGVAAASGGLADDAGEDALAGDGGEADHEVEHQHGPRQAGEVGGVPDHDRQEEDGAGDEIGQEDAHEVMDADVAPHAAVDAEEGEDDELDGDGDGQEALQGLDLVGAELEEAQVEGEEHREGDGEAGGDEDEQRLEGKRASDEDLDQAVQALDGRRLAAGGGVGFAGWVGSGHGLFSAGAAGLGGRDDVVEGGADAGGVGLGHAREDGQGDDFLVDGLGDGEVARAVAVGLAVVGMEVEGEVVDAGADLMGLEGVDDGIAVDAGAGLVDAHDEEVPGVAGIGALAGEAEAGMWARPSR